MPEGLLIPEDNELLADLSDMQIHLLASVEEVAHVNKSRQEIFEKLVEKSNRFDENSELRLLPATTLKNLASTLGLSQTDSRDSIAKRIVQQARDAENNAQGNNQQNNQQENNNEHQAYDPSTMPANNPRSIEIIPLESIQSKVKVENWIQDIKITAQVRQVEGILDSLLEKEIDEQGRQIIYQGLNGLQTQTMQLILQGIRNSLGESLAVTLFSDLRSGKCKNRCECIIDWARGYTGDLGNAIEAKAIKSFHELSFKRSKTDLHSWVSQLRQHATDFGITIPEGIARESMVREKILTNIKENVSDTVKLILNSFRLKECTDKGYEVDDLVQQLSKEFFKLTEKGEQQCQVFSVQFQGQGGKNSFNTFYNGKNNSNGKGKGKKTFPGKGSKWNNTGYNSQNQGYQNNNSNTGDKWCTRCAAFYSDNGWPINYRLVQSHNQAQCRISQQKNEKNAGNKPNKGGGKNNTVKKDNHKKGKGGGKGKGKGKGKKGGGKNS